MVLEQLHHALQVPSRFRPDHVLCRFVCTFGDQPHQEPLRPSHLHGVETIRAERELQQFRHPGSGRGEEVKAGQAEGGRSKERLHKEQQALRSLLRVGHEGHCSIVVKSGK